MICGRVRYPASTAITSSLERRGAIASLKGMRIIREIISWREKEKISVGRSVGSRIHRCLRQVALHIRSLNPSSNLSTPTMLHFQNCRRRSHSPSRLSQPQRPCPQTNDDSQTCKQKCPLQRRSRITRSSHKHA